MEKGSKFLAFLSPVNNEIESQVFLSSLKKLHPKARHLCTALRLGPEASIERSNDDGEPGGSAGKPILGQLIKNNLTNIIVVVVRYFGGTKLGIPGLIEAYKTSTAEAIAKASIIKKTVYSAVYIQMSYDMFPAFKNQVLQMGIPLFNESFEDHALIKIGFHKSTWENELLAFLKDFSRRDFETLEAYSQYLGVEVSGGIEEIIT